MDFLLLRGGGEEGFESADNDEGVKEEGAVFDIVEFIFQFGASVGDGRAVAEVDLSPAGNAGFNDMAEFVEGNVFLKLAGEFRTFGAGADERKFAF